VRHVVRLPLEKIQPYLLDVPPAPGSLDYADVFANDRPIELEVGFGKGLFLLTASQARPDVNFLGIEIEKKYQLFTANRMAKRGLMNVRLVCADARAFVRDFLPAGQLAAVHVYFPDPWWKNRHHKRRLFTEEFARQCVRVLRPGGCLHLASDVADYFARMTELTGRSAGLERLPPADTRQPEHDLDYLTNFERKFRKEGRAIYRAAYRRADLSAT
jgi:tRNA (guanine-N7-)-methyltransferase